MYCDFRTIATCVFISVALSCACAPANVSMCVVFACADVFTCIVHVCTCECFHVCLVCMCESFHMNSHYCSMCASVNVSTFVVTTEAFICMFALFYA